MALVVGKAIDRRADTLQSHCWMPDLTCGWASGIDGGTAPGGGRRAIVLGAAHGPWAARHALGAVLSAYRWRLCRTELAMMTSLIKEEEPAGSAICIAAATVAYELSPSTAAAFAWRAAIAALASPPAAAAPARVCPTMAVYGAELILDGEGAGHRCG